MRLEGAVTPRHQHRSPPGGGLALADDRRRSPRQIVIDADNVSVHIRRTETSFAFPWMGRHAHRALRPLDGRAVAPDEAHAGGKEEQQLGSAGMTSGRIPRAEHLATTCLPISAVIGLE
ncbi:hypothetical protein ACSRUE_31385 [Sorangium sp. KYC3313]|uniref:hypothetical protein n=1 Tax=Sorangium sp. KYC3313 TaxID=3449740 RepID=UPI003F8B0B7C